MKNDKNKKVFVAIRSPSCPAARTYARSVQTLANSFPEIDFIAILPTAEGLEEFKEKVWENGRLFVDTNLVFWDFIWY